MTICIAAISNQRSDRQGPYIATISDTMISGGTISADASTLKYEQFHPDWIAMMAADDITQCLPIIAKASDYFANRKNTLAVARAAFKRAFRKHLIEMREDAVLGQYGMTLDEFLRCGKRRFTATKFDSLCERLEAIDPKCEFIVHGFDFQGKPHIFHVHSLGSDSVWDKPGFCAIGSGKWAAETMLFSLNQSIDCSLSETIYNICAAKFMAEKSDGVGEYSALYARRQGSSFFSHGFGMLEEIRQAWEKDGCPKVPTGIVQKIDGFGIAFS